MAYRVVSKAALGAALGLSAACLSFDPFTCAQDAQCDREDQGRCMVGSCAYPNLACPSGYSYDTNATDLGGQCVAQGGSGSTTADTNDTRTASSETGTDTADTVSLGDTATDTAGDTTETGAPACGASGEACCPGDTCDSGLGCLGDGCSCVASIAAGDRHTCATKLDGTVHCWGANERGQIGQIAMASSLTPLEVPGPFGVGMGATLISARNHTCVLRADSVPYCWGDNALGQVLPASGLAVIPNPTIASWASGATAVAAGGGHTCAARGIVTTTCWGNNASGQLTSAAAGPTPVDYAGGVQFAQLALGNDFGCGAQITGAVQCWGNNAFGQLASDPVVLPTSNIPVTVPLGNAALLVAGGEHACAQVGTGVQCWGRGAVGQLGDGLGVTSFTPVTVGLPAAAVPVQMVAGPNHTCIRTSPGEVYCWGSNDNGQIVPSADKQVDQFTLTPVLLDIGVTAVDLATGATHTCVLSSGGDVLCWGINTEGQLGNGTDNYGFEPTPALLDCP